MAIVFDTKNGDDLETIKRRLTEATAWFESLGQRPDSGFPRSALFSPSHLQTNRPLVVQGVADERNWWLKKNSPAIVGRLDGRLLGYAPDEMVWDGASEAATGGFFDGEDEPP